MTISLSSTNGTAPNLTPRIPNSTFSAAYQKFLNRVAFNPKSDGPFEGFRSGLAALWEQYKEWLYYEARRRLDVQSWRQGWIGTGKILQHVIASIEIHEDQNHRNNIVQWDGRRGEGSDSHRRLRLARTRKPERTKAEDMLYGMYRTKKPSKDCFSELAEHFGARYDLISYLFFLRDWERFMPVRPTVFSAAFAELGIPHEMTKRCSWDNYEGFLERLREVQRALSEYDIQGGVRLIDAHSFCWMLVRLPSAKPRQEVVPEVLQIKPRAGAAPEQASSDRGHLEQKDLDGRLRHQKRIGDLAQSIVLKAERKRLADIGLGELSKQVADVSDRLSLGYDIDSFTAAGAAKPIEVKAVAKRGDDLRFFLSDNERSRSQTLPNYTFALVVGVEASQPQILEFRGRDLPSAALFPANYEVRLRDTSAEDP